MVWRLPMRRMPEHFGCLAGLALGIERALDAGSTRFLPVLMTALAMIIGMAPMAIEPGQNAPLGRAVIGRLLCHTVIPKHEIEREFSINFDEYFAPELQRLEEARDEGLVVLDSAEIRVTPLGRIFIRNVAMAFDRYLHEQQMDHKPLFSKTL